MSSSSSSAGEDFKTLTRNDEKESTAKQESVSVQSLEEKSLQKDSTAKEEPVFVQSLEETFLTLTSPDDKDSTVDVQSAVETSASKDDKDSTIKESSVSIQSVEEELLTWTSKDGKDYDFKESAREEFQASSSKESTIHVPSARDKFLTLKSKDDQEFTVIESVAFQSPYIKRLAKEGSASTGIHILEIEGMALAPVLEYLNMKHRESEASDEEKQKYELEELEKKELGFLFDFLFAAEFLQIRDLPEIINQAIRDNIKNIQLPYSPKLPDIDYDPSLEEDDDEEERVRTEYPSDFDD